MNKYDCDNCENQKTRSVFGKRSKCRRCTVDLQDPGSKPSQYKRKIYSDEERVSDFLDELDKLCIKYRLSISHQDTEGSFVIEDYNKENVYWLKHAKLDLGGTNS